MYQEKPPVLGLKVDENHFVDCYDYGEEGIDNWKCFLFHSRHVDTERDRGCDGNNTWIAIQSMRGFASPEEAVEIYCRDLADGGYDDDRNN